MFLFFVFGFAFLPSANAASRLSYLPVANTASQLDASPPKKKWLPRMANAIAAVKPGRMRIAHRTAQKKRPESRL